VQQRVKRRHDQEQRILIPDDGREPADDASDDPPRCAILRPRGEPCPDQQRHRRRRERMREERLERDVEEPCVASAMVAVAATATSSATPPDWQTRIIASRPSTA
jgi:hypothetical protein